MTQSDHVGIVGAGAWGTALAIAAAQSGAMVTIWARQIETAAEINLQRTNRARLPDITIDNQLITATASLADLTDCSVVIVSIPSAFMREICTRLAPHLKPGTILCVAAKGIERGSGKLMHQLAAELTGVEHVSVLSGPTFAAEVARLLPSAILLAGTRQDNRQIATAFSHPTLRIYQTDDATGVAIGGVVKNVIAIACGISTGLGFGHNARAAIISRGLHEITRLGAALGALPETFSGLAGLGDLVLTCTSEQSRNYSFGIRMGGGESAQQIRNPNQGVVEGAENAASIVELAHRHRVDMPICIAVQQILIGQIQPSQAVDKLLSRPLKIERE